MRIYNATNSVISLPYVGSRITINPHSVSGDIGANIELLTLVVTAYDTTEVAFVVSGPYELNMCCSLPTVPNYVVQTLEEAIERFTPKNNAVEVEENTDKVEVRSMSNDAAGNDEVVEEDVPNNPTEATEPAQPEETKEVKKVSKKKKK